MQPGGRKKSGKPYPVFFFEKLPYGCMIYTSGGRQIQGKNLRGDRQMRGDITEMENGENGYIQHKFRTKTN